MPPSRRRPIPTPPVGGRPKVAGLHRRAAEPGTPEAEEVTSAAPVAPEGVEELDELKAPTPDEWTPPSTKQAKKPAEKKSAEKQPAAEKEPAGKKADPEPAAKQAWLLPVALYEATGCSHCRPA